MIRSIHHVEVGSMRSRSRILVSVLILLLCLSSVVFAEAINGTFRDFPIVKVKVNGTLLEPPVPGVNFHGSTLVPVRAIAEALGGTVAWNADTWVASITAPNAAELQAKVNDLQARLDQAKAQLVALTTPPAQPRIYAAGEKARVGDFNVTVNSSRTSTGTNEFLMPKQGQVYLLVDVTVENMATQAQSVSSMLFCKLQDSDAYAYGAGLAGGEGKGSIDGTLAAGRAIRGEVGFEIPATSKGLQLVFTPLSFISKAQGIFALGK
jgi:hypothetical protein